MSEDKKKSSIVCSTCGVGMEWKKKRWAQNVYRCSTCTRMNNIRKALIRGWNLR